MINFEKLIDGAKFLPDDEYGKYWDKFDREGVKAKKLECDSMPHSETLRVMEMMDFLRKSWGVKFPGE